jgi:hypothetical protein
MDQAHLDQLFDPQTIARAKALGLQARSCSGPKGRYSSAQGKALGLRRHILSSPERAELSAGCGHSGFALSGLEAICSTGTQGFALGWRVVGFQPLTHDACVAARTIIGFALRTDS